METSENLDLPYIMPSQAQKHVTHNEAVRMLDALTQIAVSGMAATEPPLAPTAGERYALPAGCTGGWAGKDGMMAAWQDGAWRFFQPRAGFVAWNAGAAELVVHDGTGWIPAAAAGGELETVPLLGVNATPDVTNRLAVAAPATLFSHDGADHRLVIDKASETDTASLLFQDDHSGRAEIGLTADDRFHVKVSEDGEAFRDAIIIDNATGAAIFPATPCGMVNLLINGSFAINQRGFAGGALSAGHYGHDRMKAGSGGADYSVSGDEVSHAGGPLVQIVENPALAGRIVTLSVEDLEGGDLTVIIEGETGTITPGVGRRKATLTVPAASTGNITVQWEPATSPVSYRRVQLNEGGEGCPFERRHPTLELALCKRYFQASIGNLLPSCASFFGNVSNGGIYYARWTFDVQMRAAPTVALTHRGLRGGSFAAATGTIYQPSPQGFIEYRTATATSIDGGFWSSFQASAEL